MKRILYFIPAILYLIITILALSKAAVTPVAWISLALLVIAGIILSIKQWWGCLFGIVVSIIVICSGTQEHGQIISEIPVGIILYTYYAIMGFVCYESRKIV